MNYKNMNADELNYIVYCRKSSESEDRQIQSLETQTRELEEHAKKNGLNIVKVIEESKSAFSTGREGFDHMLNLISSGKANALLVVRANRISRNAIDAGQVINLLDTKKLLYIRCPSSTCYTTSSTDKMMIALELIFSKKDSDDKSDMVKEGIKTKAVKGIPNGQAIIGYINNMSDEKGNRTWDNDTEKQVLVRNMFDEFLKGTHSVNSIARHTVENLKLTTTKHKKIGGKLVKPSHVSNMLKDPIYAGFFFYDGIRYELDNKLNRVISEEEYSKILIMTDNKKSPRPSSHESLYSGLIKSESGEFIGLDVKHQLMCSCKKKFAYRNRTECPSCGVEISKIVDPKYLEYKYYYNVSKRVRKEKIKTVTESEITNTVIKDLLDPLSLCPELATWCKKYINEIQDKEILKNQEVIKIKEDIDKNIENEKSRARELLMSKVFTDSDYKKEIEKIESKAVQVKSINVNNDWVEKLNNIIDIGIEGRKIFESSGPVNYKKEVLIKSRSNLIWNENKAYIIRPLWLDKYIEGITSVKVDMSNIEPKNMLYGEGLNRNNLIEKRDFSSLLPGLGSNQD